MTDVRLSILGPPSLSFDGADLTGTLSRKALAVLVFLLCRPDRRASREHVSGLIWGRTDDQRARGSLRQQLRQLASPQRDGAPLVKCDRNFLWVEAGRIDVDADGVPCLIDRTTGASIATARRLWRGEPLDRFTVNEPDFDDWADTIRARLKGDTLYRLEKKLTAAMAVPEPDPDLVEQLAGFILDIDAAQEDAHFALIRLYAQQGRLRRSIAQFEHCRTALQRDLDVAPRADMRTFINGVRERSAAALVREETAGAFTPVPKPAILRGPDAHFPRVAVTRDGEFADMRALINTAADELIVQLSRFNALKIFSDAGGDAAQNPIARITDGSLVDFRVLLSADTVGRTVCIKTVRAHTGEVIFAGRIPADVMLDSDAAPLAMARHINVLEDRINNSLDAQNGFVSHAYASWRRAERLMRRFDPATDEEAMRILETLASDREQLSLIYSSISSILLKRRLSRPGFHAIETEMARSMELARQAVSIDRFEPFNHVISGWAALQVHDFGPARQSFGRAIELNPYSAYTNIACAEAFAYLGDVDQAEAFADRAMQLAMHTALPYFYGYLATIFFVKGDMHRCIEMCKMAPSENVETALLHASALGIIDRLDRSREMARRALHATSRSTASTVETDRNLIHQWLHSTSMFRTPEVRARYFDGLRRGGLDIGEVTTAKSCSA